MRGNADSNSADANKSDKSAASSAASSAAAVDNQNIGGTATATTATTTTVPGAGALGNEFNVPCCVNGTDNKADSTCVPYRARFTGMCCVVAQITPPAHLHTPLHTRAKKKLPQCLALSK